MPTRLFALLLAIFAAVAVAVGGYASAAPDAPAEQVAVVAGTNPDGTCVTCG